MAGSPQFKIVLECDPMWGPLISHMDRYSRAEFDNHITLRVPDPTRRQIILENEQFFAFVHKAFANDPNVEIEKKLVDVRPFVQERRSVVETLGIGRRHEDEMSGLPTFESDLKKKFEFEVQHLSGAECLELASVVITHGALGAGATTVGVALIKAVKEIVVKWLDGRGDKTVTISVGPGESIKVTGAIDDKKIEKLAASLEAAIVAVTVAKNGQKSPAREPRGKVKKKAPKLDR
jgi:hypothetical protein